MSTRKHKPQAHRNTTSAVTLSVVPRSNAVSTKCFAARADLEPAPPPEPTYSRTNATASSSVITSHTPSQAMMMNVHWRGDQMGEAGHHKHCKARPIRDSKHTHGGIQAFRAGVRRARHEFLQGKVPETAGHGQHPQHPLPQHEAASLLDASNLLWVTGLVVLWDKSTSHRLDRWRRKRDGCGCVPVTGAQRLRFGIRRHVHRRSWP